MAISRFDSPAEAPVMNTYVPIPFQELQQAALTRQQRFEEGLAAEEAVETELGTFSGLGSVYLPHKGKSVAVGDRDRVLERVSQYNNQIDQLTSKYPDKSSPEFRTAIRSIIRNMRADKAPTGLFGRAEATTAAYRDIQKRLSENEDLATSPHLGQDIYAGLEDFANKSLKEQVDLDIPASIGKPMDVVGELSDQIKNMKTMIGENAFTEDGYIKSEYLETLTPERIQQAAMGVINSRPDLQRYVARESQYYGRDPQEAIQGLANTMVDLFQKQAYKKDLKGDPTNKANKNRLLSGIGEEIAVAVPGQVYTPRKVEDNIKDLGKSIQDKETEISQFKLDMNIPQGSTIGVDEYGNKKDFASTLAIKNNEKQNMLDEKARFEKFNSLAREQSGWTDEYLYTKLEDPKVQEEAIKAAENEFYASLRSFNPHTGGIDTKKYESKEQENAEKEDYINNNWQRVATNKLKQDDTNYKKYEQVLQGFGNTSAETAVVYPLTKELVGSENVDFIEGLVNKYGTSFDIATKEIVNTNTGLPIEDEGEWKKMNFEKAKFFGYLFGPSGELKLNYIVPSKDTNGENTSIVRNAPKGLEKAVLEGNQDFLLQKIIKDQISYNFKDISEDMQQDTVYLGLAGLKKEIPVIGPNFNKRKGKWTAAYKIEGEEVPLEIEADNKEELVSKLAFAYEMEANSKYNK